MIPKLTAVKPLQNYRLWVKYSDGVEGEVDLSKFVGQPAFQAWDDYREFEKVHIGVGGELVWNEKIDMCADAVYMDITGKTPAEMFPKLRELAERARD